MLTFDKIRDLEREERAGKRLQKLPGDVMEQLKEYLRRKERIAEKTSSDIQEMENLKNTIKRFFELREAKIISSAIDTARTGMPPENMSKDEESYFYRIVGVLNEQREKFFEELQKEPCLATQEECKQEEDVRKNTKLAEGYRVTKEKKFSYIVRKTIPSFVGPEGNVYELKENDVIEIGALPKPLNDLLIKEGVIEKIET
jgi:DNA replication initiation complex subunit (GINS family)